MTSLIIAYMTTIISAGINAETASAIAAQEFNFYRNLSDSEIRDLVIELANRFPQYDQGQWYALIKSIKYYGMGIYEPPQTSIIPPGASSTPPDDSLYWWLAVGAIFAFMVIGK